MRLAATATRLGAERVICLFNDEAGAQRSITEAWDTEGDRLGVFLLSLVLKVGEKK